MELDDQDDCSAECRDITGQLCLNAAVIRAGTVAEGDSVELITSSPLAALLT
jgi:hypothetical protein